MLCQAQRTHDAVAQHLAWYVRILTVHLSLTGRVDGRDYKVATPAHPEQKAVAEAESLSLEVVPRTAFAADRFFTIGTDWATECFVRLYLAIWIQICPWHPSFS